MLLWKKNLNFFLKKYRKMGVADHARCESRRIFSYFIYITCDLSYHLEQKFSKNTLHLQCSGQPVSDGRTDRQTDGRTHEHSEIINIDCYVIILSLILTLTSVILTLTSVINLMY